VGVPRADGGDSAGEAQHHCHGADGEQQFLGSAVLKKMLGKTCLSN
jgi:hypothetical protein